MIKLITPIAACALSAAAALAQNYYIPVDLAPFANERISARLPAFPEGTPVLGGVPFVVARGINNVWSGNIGGGSAPRALTLPVNLTGLTEVHTLVNTAWGTAQTPALARVEFLDDSMSVVHSDDLVGNIDIRDWNQLNFTNSINGTTSTTVFSVGTTRVDKQRIVLPSALASTDIRYIRFVDNGAENLQRLLVQGITLVIDQPASRQWSPLVGGNCHSYNAYQVPTGITWTDADIQADALGGELVAIDSAEENAFAYSLVGGNGAFWSLTQTGDGEGPWIGGVQAPNAPTTSGWGWVTGEAFGYTNWAFGEPNDFAGRDENRLHFFGSRIPRNNTWNDFPATSLTRGYIVEFSFCAADYNADGGVDGSDVQAFFDEWVNAGGCSDVNADGGVDGTDVQAFFDVWVSGGC
jgi:hypothetical protein